DGQRRRTWRHGHLRGRDPASLRALNGPVTPVPRRRFVSTSVGVLLALLVGAAAAWLLLPPLPGDDVPVPPPDASPAEVVTAFLAALDSPDCDTAEALTGVDVGVDAWCGSVAALEDVRVREA